MADFGPRPKLATVYGHLQAFAPGIEPGESVVGTGVALKHLAATPVGHRVTAEAEVTKVEGRRIEFEVVARDDDEIIGTGTHERMVVDLERLGKRLAAHIQPELDTNEPVTGYDSSTNGLIDFYKANRDARARERGPQ